MTSEVSIQRIFATATVIAVLALVMASGAAFGELKTTRAATYVALNDEGSCMLPPISTRRISLDLRDADLELVLQHIGKESGTNIVLERGVGGTVTLTVSATPLNEVLLAVLDSNHLCWESIGENILLVSPR